MLQNKKYKKYESGNVLFLILIAVALFAALSYAVTQSSRTTTGNTQREQSLIGSAGLTQYPTSLRTSLMRMVVSGLSPTQLLFDSPASFPAVSTYRLVFHPDGGTASYQEAPVDVMAQAIPGTWTHNMHMYVPNVGKNPTAGVGGNDLIVFLVGVSEPACLRINQQMGIATSAQCGTYVSGVPQIDVATNTNITTNMTNGYSVPSNPVLLQCTGGTADAFTARASGCFYDPNVVAGGANVFYSVLIER